jgi:hypothetical protein
VASTSERSPGPFGQRLGFRDIGPRTRAAWRRREHAGEEVSACDNAMRPASRVSCPRSTGHERPCEPSAMTRRRRPAEVSIGFGALLWRRRWRPTQTRQRTRGSRCPIGTGTRCASTALSPQAEQANALHRHSAGGRSLGGVGRHLGSPRLAHTTLAPSSDVRDGHRRLRAHAPPTRGRPPRRAIPAVTASL